MESALEMLRQKTVTGYKLMAYFLFAAGFVFVCLGAYEFIMALSSGRWVMALFLLGISFVFIVVGIGALRTGKK
jgi:hypothetical protein